MTRLKRQLRQSFVNVMGAWTLWTLPDHVVQQTAMKQALFGAVAVVLLVRAYMLVRSDSNA